MNRQKNQVDMREYLNRKVHIKLQGGREITGMLISLGEQCDMVLEDSVEYMRDLKDLTVVTSEKRPLGTIIIKGTSLLMASPEDGFEETVNPFTEKEA